jgi:hypothetical protein
LAASCNEDRSVCYPVVVVEINCIKFRALLDTRGVHRIGLDVYNTTISQCLKSDPKLSNPNPIRSEF